MALVLGLVVLVAVPPSPLPGGRPNLEPDCFVEPLKLTLPEVASLGWVQGEVARHHCLQRTDASLTPLLRRPYPVGKTRLGQLHLFGERLGFGFDVVVRPGALGRPDDIYAVPALDLPERWMWVIDRATYPAVVVGGAAILTTVILELVR